MSYVDGRQPNDLRKKLCDVICVGMTLLTLINEDANDRAVWGRAINLKKSIQHAGILTTHVDSEC